jgi:bacteriorhodopsin
MAVLYQRNEALDINPPAGNQYLSVNGSNWLWTVTAVFCLSFLIFLGLMIKPKNGEKIFHYLFTVTLFIGTLCYYAMASDLGWLVIKQANEVDRSGLTRQIFYGKYIYWVVSFPVSILSLGLMSGLSWASIIYNIFMSWIWVISYLISAFVVTNYKWGFFAFGTFAYLVLGFETLFTGMRGAKRVGTTTHYMLLAGWLNTLWLLYPIAFGLSDGGNYIKETASLVWFGVLDILMIPIIGFAVVAFSYKWDFNALNLYFTQYGRVAKGGDLPEKTPAPANTGMTAEAAA